MLRDIAPAGIMLNREMPLGVGGCLSHGSIAGQESSRCCARVAEIECKSRMRKTTKQIQHTR